MYVRQVAREAGIGRRLAEAVVEYAQTRVEILQLTVVSSNQAARQLYRRLGFVEYGIEKNGLKASGCYWDDVLMAKPLSMIEPARP
jgi:ribosomal protein S18 acetylase RimI-like enzyme